jgi:NAD(P)-dependent dehydrogenase (short-subunit alcohol dehydrogenase family)
VSGLKIVAVNNVGKQYEYPMYLGEVPEAELWDIINVNVGATTLMTRLVINGMKERRRGAIVNISSGSELQPLPLMTVYAATKVYVRSFSEALRAEYSQFGLTIQHLTPLFVNTKMNAFSQRLQVRPSSARTRRVSTRRFQASLRPTVADNAIHDLHPFLPLPARRPNPTLFCDTTWQRYCSLKSNVNLIISRPCTDPLTEASLISASFTFNILSILHSIF